MTVTLTPITGGGLTYGPLSELDAINEMLRAIGEQPFPDGTDLSTITLNEGINARKKLHRVNRDIQNIGLECNTEEQDISNVSGEYYELPTNTLRADSKYFYQRYVLKYDSSDGNQPKLYDTEENTFNIAALDGDGDITCTVVLFLTWEELPTHVRTHVVAQATLEFQQDTLGSDSVDQTLRERAMKAQVEFFHKEAEQSDDSMFDAPSMGNIKRINTRNPIKGGIR
jgi:hypothetical protein